MNRRKAIGGGLAGLFLSTGISQALGQEDEGKATSEFEGKYLCVNISSLKFLDGCLLEKARIQELGNRSFLVGSGVGIKELEKNFYGTSEGVTFWIPIEQIVMVQVYSSKEEMLNNLKDE